MFKKSAYLFTVDGEIIYILIPIFPEARYKYFI